MDNAQIFGSLIALAIFVFLLVDVWRSNLTTGAKVGWSVAAFFCSLLTLIVWLVWGRKQAPSA